MDGDVRFATKGGSVHVLDPKLPMESWSSDDVWTIAESIMRLPIGVTRCGRDATGLQGWGEVRVFEDDRICIRCVRTVPEDQRHLLFRHPTS